MICDMLYACYYNNVTSKIFININLVQYSNDIFTCGIHFHLLVNTKNFNSPYIPIH